MVTSIYKINTDHQFIISKTAENYVQSKNIKSPYILVGTTEMREK